MAWSSITTARSLAFGLFRDRETDWVFRRTLEFMGEKGAEIGECLYAARRIDERNGGSWIAEWSGLADRVAGFGVKALEEGHIVSARECFLRASNYYRTAEYGTPPSHPLFESLWRKSVESFRSAAALFEPALQPVEVVFEDKRLSGYFWPAAAGAEEQASSGGTRRAPTLMAAGGNDSSLEEIVLWCGMAAVRRGYNFFTFDHPGHRGAVHAYPDCVKRPDYEKPYGAAIDLLQALPGVDERIALAGYSFGGYVACRVASSDPRVRAVVPDSPIIDLLEASVAFRGDLLDFVRKLPPFAVNMMGRMARRRMRRTPVLKAFNEYTDWTAGMHGKGLSAFERLNAGIELLRDFSVRDRLGGITVPALALVSDGDGPALIGQARRFIDGIASTMKRIHVFGMERDGSDDHCQLDNRSRGAQVMFDFLDEAFSHRRGAGQP